MNVTCSSVKSKIQMFCYFLLNSNMYYWMPAIGEWGKKWKLSEWWYREECKGQWGGRGMNAGHSWVGKEWKSSEWWYREKCKGNREGKRYDEQGGVPYIGHTEGIWMRGRRARKGACIGVTEGTQGEVHTRGKCEEGGAGLYKKQMHMYPPMVILSKDGLCQ